MRFGKTIGLIVALFLAVAIGAGAGPAAAAPAASTSTCVQTTVVLHGSKPATSSCTRWATAGVVTPATNMTSCANSARSVDIYDYSGHDVCFTGTGYLGYSIPNVQAISSLNWGWVRMYHGGSGWFETLRGDGKWYYYPTSTLITQVCIAC